MILVKGRFFMFGVSSSNFGDFSWCHHPYLLFSNHYWQILCRLKTFSRFECDAIVGKIQFLFGKCFGGIFWWNPCMLDTPIAPYLLSFLRSELWCHCCSRGDLHWLAVHLFSDLSFHCQPTLNLTICLWGSFQVIFSQSLDYLRAATGLQLHYGCLSSDNLPFTSHSIFPGFDLLSLSKLFSIKFMHI